MPTGLAAFIGYLTSDLSAQTATRSMIETSFRKGQKCNPEDVYMKSVRSNFNPFKCHPTQILNQKAFCRRQIFGRTSFFNSVHLAPLDTAWIHQEHAEGI